MNLPTILTLIWSGVALRYDVNEVLRCNIEYTDFNERRWCIETNHYRQMWLQCEFGDADPY